MRLAAPGSGGTVPADALREVCFGTDSHCHLRLPDGTVSLADAHLAILWRSARLSLPTTLITFAAGSPRAWFIVVRPLHARGLSLFRITIPFWTNLPIRAFAINEVIRNGSS